MIPSVNGALVRLVGQSSRSLPLIKLLIAAGADLTIAGTYKKTPLSNAERFGETETADWIRAQGVTRGGGPTGGW
jgi:hypothetical protein